MLSTFNEKFYIFYIKSLKTPVGILYLQNISI